MSEKIAERIRAGEKRSISEKSRRNARGAWNEWSSALAVERRRADSRREAKPLARRAEATREVHGMSGVAR
jgi:hypothetical protein